jgi:hypothetical protein
MNISFESFFVVGSVLIPNMMLMLSVFIISKYMFPDVNNVCHTFIAGLTLGVVICFLYPPLLYSKIEAISVILYLSISLLALIIVILKKKTYDLVKVNKFQAFLWLSLTANIIFVHYYDAFKSISPSNIDSLTNYQWINYNLTSPDLGYFPGVTIISNISYLIVDPIYNLNYFSVSVSLIILLSINLILINILSSTSLFIYNLILVSPIYYPLLYTRIGLNNGVLFSLFFYAIITIFIKYKYFLKFNIINLIIILITLFAAALAAPHMLLLIFPPIIYSFWVVRHQVSSKMLSLILFFYGAALTLGISFDLKIPTYWKYLISSPSPSPSPSPFLSDSFPSLLGELIRVKYPIRPIFESYLSLFAYIFSIIIFIGLVYALKYKSIKYQIILGFCFYLDIISLTGIFEFSYLKGRSGWYLMYALALLACIVFDDLIKYFQSFKQVKYLNTLLLIGVLSSLFFSILVPPKPYRFQNEDGLIYMKNIVEKNQSSSINLKTDLLHANLIDSRILVNKFLDTELWQYDYILLNLQSNIPDLFLANLRRYEDRNFQKFISDQKNVTRLRLEFNQNIVDNATKFGKFTYLESNSNFILLKRTYL